MATPVLSQVRLLKGKIAADYPDLEKVTITNLNSKAFVTSEENGYFEIKASMNDTLRFSAVQFVEKKILVTESMLKQNPCYVQLKVAEYLLEEVIVNEYKDINAVKLGIIPKPAKKFTPAERRLNEAITGSGLIPLNPILNAISGRTKQLKKEIEIEKLETLLKKINDWFEDNYYVEKFGIPADYVDGFKYFLIENEAFRNAVNAKNKTLAVFLMAEVATAYKARIEEKP